MPAVPRREIFDPHEVGVYHVTSKIVRGYYLAGSDRRTGEDFSHRKEWIETRVKQLSHVLSIDILGYAILDNHFHIQVRNRPDQVAKLTDREVARRYLMVSTYSMPDSNSLPEPEDDQIDELCDDPERIKVCRQRLSDVSWFMRCLKEPIARRANIEDDAKGHFWQQRFHMTRMLDAFGVFLCSLYIDLNEVRAGTSETPEESQHSSIGHRIGYWLENDDSNQQSRRLNDEKAIEPAPYWLSPISVQSYNSTASSTMTEETPNSKRRRASDSGFLDCSLEQYIEVCDKIGRICRPGKQGAIPQSMPDIFDRLVANKDALSATLKSFRKLFPRVCGTPESMQKEVDRRGIRFCRGIGASRNLTTDS